MADVVTHCRQLQMRMNRGHSCCHGTCRSSSEQSRVADVDSGSDMTMFRLPMIIPPTPQTTTTSDGSVSAHPPRGRPRHDVVPQPSLPSVGQHHNGRIAWTGHCTPSASLHTGNLPVLVKLFCKFLSISYLLTYLLTFSSFLRQSCLVFTNVTSALEVFLMLCAI